MQGRTFKSFNGDGSMKVLFLNDHNLYEAKNPEATLLEIPDHWTPDLMRKLENTIPGVGRMGGSWRMVVDVCNILPYTVISKGQKSDYKKEDYDIEYTVISGNY